MSFKSLIADMDLDTVDLTEDEEKSFDYTERKRVKIEDEIKTESEVIEVHSSPEQTGDESQTEINLALLEIESDKEEEKNGNLIEESSQNELGLKLNLEGKEDNNNNGNVLSLESNVSAIENMDLRFILLNGEKDAKSDKMKGIYANEDLVSELRGNYEYEDSEGLVENNEVISIENEKDENPKKSLDLEISEIKGLSEKMQGKKLDLKGFYANSEIEGQNEKTGLELVLVSEIEGNENQESEKIEGQNGNMDFDLVLVNNEGNENQESEKIEGQNEKMDLALVLVTNEENENEAEIIEGQNEKMDLDLPLAYLKHYKRKKTKSENSKNKTDQTVNFPSALVLYNENKNLNKRERKKSIYLSPPYINSTFKRAKIDSHSSIKIISAGEEQNNNNIEKIVKDKFTEKILFNLNSAAQNPTNPKLTKSIDFNSFSDFIAKFRNSTSRNYYTIHPEPAVLLLKFTITPSEKDLIAKFTKYGVLLRIKTHENDSARIVFARKEDAESAFNALNGSNEFEIIRLRCLPAELAVRPPAVLSEVREKVVEIVERLNGSDLDMEMDLVGDAKGLLAKVNYAMSKDCCANNNNNKAIIMV